MKKYAIIGYPLGHSLSPLVHTMILEEANIKAEYMLLSIPPEQLDQTFMETLKNLDGFNITIPHKVSMIKHMDRLDERGALFGAINTVKLGEEVVGYNTDCYGFLMALQRAHMELKGNVLLCGSGGVARMIAFECALAGCNLTIATRESSVAEAKKVADEIEEKLAVHVHTTLLSDVHDGYDLIVNGTPVGMYPNVDAMPLSADVVAASKAVFETIYNPRDTLLLKTAQANGLACANGMAMFVCQAVKAQEIFNDVHISESAIDRMIERAYTALEEQK